MSRVFLVKHSALGGPLGNGAFLGVVGEGESWSALGCEAMRLEYEARAERHEGKAIMFAVFFERDGVADQASFDAFREKQRRQPVVNVWD